MEYLDKKADAFQFREEAAEDALDALEKIKNLLNDDALNDLECYERIDRIVKALYVNGISVRCHDME